MKPIRAALDWLGWERVSQTEKRHEEIIKLLKGIMATQAEIVAQLTAVKDQLVAANGRLTTITTIATKIGTETDGLKQRITDLEDAVNNQTNASPELVAAFNAVKEQVDAQGTAIDSLQAGITAVDDKVTDVPPTP